MRRILLLGTVAAMMAVMMAVAGAASATIHPLAKMECANENASSVVQTQDPPGLTPPPVGTGKSQGSPPNNPTGTTLAQPVFAVTPEGEPLFAGGPEGTNPSGGASANALKAEGC